MFVDDFNAPTSPTALHEVNSQFVEVWRMLARRAGGSEVLDCPGIVIAWSNRLWPILNAIIFSTPVHNTDDLKIRIKSAMDYADRRDRSWTLVICQEWMSKEVRRCASQIFPDYPLRKSFSLKGMMANQWLPPRRLLPDITLRRVNDRETRCAVADLNAISYGLPQEWGREALDHEEMWHEGIIGYVGYVNHEPVTCACAYLIDKCLYVALVATHPGHRKRGYAEAVIRYTLNEAATVFDYTHSVLHATVDGYPLYAAMGYRAVGTFTAYTSQWFE
jgi:GNAT superfamily N-acetyltransferase